LKKIDIDIFCMSSSMSLFLNGASDDLSTSINLGTPKVNASGGKNIPIFNKLARNGLKVETPMMTTWGVNENDYDGTGKKSYNMSLQFPSGEYAREDTSAFLENIKKMEGYVNEQACANSKAWFGKVQSKEVVEAFWTPMLRYPKDKATGEPDMTKSPTFRIKIPFWEGQFKCEIYNVHRELIFPKEGVDIMDVIPKGSEVKIMLQCGGIWFAGGKFGITWKPYQIIVKPKQQLTPGVCHMVISEGDLKVKAEPELKVEISEHIESDDEDPDAEYRKPAEGESVAEPGEPEVPVKGKKKVVKKGVAC
jgi:hypothetical protein